MAPPTVPPGVLANFDQVYEHNARSLDKIVAAHRSFCETEYDRIVSILAQVDAARMQPEGAFHMFAVAVDRLARAER